MTIEDDVPGTPADDTAPASDETSTPPVGDEPEGDQPETDTEDQQPEGDDAQGASEDGDDEPPAPERRRGPSGAERAKRRIERLERENRELRARAAPIGDVSAEVAKRLGPPPKEADFNGDYSEYTFARNAYETDKRMLTRSLQEQSSREQSSRMDRMQDMLEAHNDRLEDFVREAPDYFEVVGKAGGPTPSPGLLEMIMESDQSPAVAYYLAKNPRQYAALVDMEPARQAREIGRIEASLSRSPQQRQQSRAPKPIPRMSGGVAPPSADAEINAYVRRRYGDR